MPKEKHLIYEEKIRHGTAELPIALHKLSYPEGADTPFYLHWHKEFEILVMTGGQMELTIEDHSYHLQKDDIVFINSNLNHSAKTINKAACDFFAIDFSYQFLKENLHTSFGRKYIRPVLSAKLLFPEIIHAHDTDWGEKILYALTAICSCPEHDLAPYELMIKSRIFLVWDELFSHAVPVKSRMGTADTVHNERLAPILSYIHENYNYEITLSELAGMIPMSEGQFCRVFKQSMKLSPMQYIMRYRILQSCQLLLDTEKKIGEIANLSGFNNSSYYNKVFLQIIGCSPSEYRKADRRT